MKPNPGESGQLYVVATPIGHPGDLGARAAEVLGAVPLVYAEDTRVARALLRTLGASPALHSLHEHNERDRAVRVVQSLLAGQDAALVSDAGTPLISDPGYRVVDACHAAGIRVVPVPGACAVTAALCVSGLPTDRFTFEGFLPKARRARRRRLDELAEWPHTLVFYEAPHRLAEAFADMAELFGEARSAMLGRELTKHYETVRRDGLGALRDFVAADTNQQRGEAVIVVRGAPDGPRTQISVGATALLERLAAELPPRRAAAVVAELGGGDKRSLYAHLSRRED